MSAILPAAGHWMTNLLGAFRLENDTQLPVFEAFGYGNLFSEVYLEPRLKAFKPYIEGAVTLNTVYQDPQKVRVIQPQRRIIGRTATPTATTGNTNESDRQKQQESQTRQQQKTPPSRTGTLQFPVRTTQEPPSRDVQRKQPNIEINYDSLKFNPRRAINIRILRPEDMVMLEFEFHNFSFTNKGQSHYLEPDDKKEAGVMVVWFQSQHTLEEAYFEASPIPDPDPLKPKEAEITFPAKFLRARKSRLVYELPIGHEGFPLIMSELLDWSKFNLRVHPRAWIKLPSLTGIRIPEKFTLNRTGRVQPNNNLKYLDAPSTEYGLKLAQNNKARVSNLEVYNQDQISKVLAPQKAVTVNQAFNVQVLKKIEMEVAPIPDMSTSIEAPALMYISPNQINDFFHKTEITFRDVTELAKRESTDIRANTAVLTTQVRVLDPLSTNKGLVTELWHTRLGVKLKDGKTSASTLKNMKTIRVL